MVRLARYDWPGNVRQLRNAVRQLVIGSRGLPQLQSSPGFESLLATGGRPVEAGAEPPAAAPAVSPPAPSAPPVAARRRKPSDISQDELLAVLRAPSLAPETRGRGAGDLAAFALRADRALFGDPQGGRSRGRGDRALPSRVRRRSRSHGRAPEGLRATLSIAASRARPCFLKRAWTWSRKALSDGSGPTRS